MKHFLGFDSNLVTARFLLDVSVRTCCCAVCGSDGRRTIDAIWTWSASVPSDRRNDFNTSGRRNRCVLMVLGLCVLQASSSSRLYANCFQCCRPPFSAADHFCMSEHTCFAEAPQYPRGIRKNLGRNSHAKSLLGCSDVCPKGCTFTCYSLVPNIFRVLDAFQPILIF